MGAADAACDRRMDGLSHTSADFVVLFWKTMAHRMSPLTTQWLLHIHAMCNRETDGPALIAACQRCSSVRINSVSVHGCAYDCACMCAGSARVHRINRELQMLPSLLLCDIPIHFDEEPSSVYTNIKKTHEHTLLQTAGP